MQGDGRAGRRKRQHERGQRRRSGAAAFGIAARRRVFGAVHRVGHHHERLLQHAGHSRVPLRARRCVYAKPASPVCREARKRGSQHGRIERHDHVPRVRACRRIHGCGEIGRRCREHRELRAFHIAHGNRAAGPVPRRLLHLDFDGHVGGHHRRACAHRHRRGRQDGACRRAVPGRHRGRRHVRRQPLDSRRTSRSPCRLRW